MLIYKYDDTYISTVRSAIETYTAESATDITLDMQDGQGNQATQNDQLDVLIQKGVDVILINAVDAGSGQGLADKCIAAGIPFIFFNREPDHTVLQPLGEDGEPGDIVGLFVGTTASEAGVMQGDILADLWESRPETDLNGDGTCQYLVFKGEPGNPEAEARSTYCVSEMEDRGIPGEDVNGAPLVANWMTDQAQSQMEAILGAKQGEIEAVYCNNDDMALGVIAALNSIGYNNGGMDEGNWIPVIGVDATDAGMAAVESGKMYGTVKQDGDAMGKALVAVAVNAGHGAAAPYVDGTGYELAEDGVSIRIPYSPIS
ncbi:MAG: substrate-binding domain-containing protein [Ruminococcaceae bacterium]|nr:substrate-binding domain-containing protein [Oscillospiraceae bacterium]